MDTQSTPSRYADIDEFRTQLGAQHWSRVLALRTALDGADAAGAFLEVVELQLDTRSALQSGRGDGATLAPLLEAADRLVEIGGHVLGTS